ncbi:MULTISPECIES: ArdC-like ssDNA-binding domain-containing protein [Priestia]|uniref:ArdC-like ssDNA-binding domain-containing protein n=1 Tax=Priestia TaxID=2800373 RepID=UPI0012B7C521|nr:ArdC-like ssDNA-binding domain-containing protein [Priestia megaterium]
MQKKSLEDIIEKLETGIKDVMTSDRFAEWLKFASSFHKYSFGNAMLIFLQNPKATMVKGFGEWKKDGRYVKKGEKAIKILAPIVKKKDKSENKDDKTDEHEIVGFRYVNVFDVSQTKGKELPSVTPKLLEGGNEEQEKLLTSWIKTLNIPVIFKDTGEANGYFHLKENYIAIHKDRSVMQQLKTLIHEYAHYLLHRKDGGEFKDVTIDIKEAQAESIAYVVMNHFNFDTSEYSFSYIAGWSQDINVMKKIGDQIIKSSHQIIEKLNKAADNQEQEIA